MVDIFYFKKKYSKNKNTISFFLLIIELIRIIGLIQEEAEKKKAEQKQLQTENKPKKLTVAGVELTSEQEKILKDGGYIYLENMNRADKKGKLSLYIFLNEDKNRVFSSKENPDSFMKYGKYEMRVRDKILVEKGYVTKAKVKWWGGGSYAHIFLWKVNKADMEYQEPWGDPRIKKEEKQEQKPEETKQEVSKIQEKKRGRKM